MTDDLSLPGATLLARARSLETLESAYETWAELERERDLRLANVRAQQVRLSEQGNFLVGAVRAAGTGSVQEGLAPADGFLSDAEAQLAVARRGLEERQTFLTAHFEASIHAAQALIKERVVRFLERVKPALTLIPRALGAERSILHLERLTGDAPILVLHLLTQSIAARYDFLSDDSTEDPALGPSTRYGPGPNLRPTASELKAEVLAKPRVLPVKGILPVFAPEPTASATFFRLVSRGPVLEAEIQEGEGFRNVLTRAESELLAGAFVRLQLGGRIQLDVRAE